MHRQYLTGFCQTCREELNVKQSTIKNYSIYSNSGHGYYKFQPFSRAALIRGQLLLILASNFAACKVHVQVFRLQ